jgi:hypothetical protein
MAPSVRLWFFTTSVQPQPLARNLAGIPDSGAALPDS